MGNDYIPSREFYLIVAVAYLSVIFSKFADIVWAELGLEYSSVTLVQLGFYGFVLLILLPLLTKGALWIFGFKTVKFTKNPKAKKKKK